MSNQKKPQRVPLLQRLTAWAEAFEQAPSEHLARRIGELERRVEALERRSENSRSLLN
jgi:polyhydroxyalkanoate synthesis regulator phasin